MKFIIDKDTFVLTTANMDKNHTPVIAVSGLNRWNQAQQNLALKFLLQFIDKNIEKWSYDNFKDGKKYKVTEIKEMRKRD